MRSSGCEVPEFMLKIKKTSKSNAKKLELNVPKRKRISTEPFPEKEARERQEKKWKITKKNGNQPPAKRPKLQSKPEKSPKTNPKKTQNKMPKFRPSHSRKTGKLHQPASQKHKVKKSAGKKSKKASTT